MKNTKKIISVLLLISILLSNCSYIFAIDSGNVLNLKFDHFCVSVLRFKGEDKLKRIAYVCYTDPSTGQKYPAFCVEPEKEGVGMGGGDNYDVTLSDLNNPALWRMLYKGYCGSKYTDWGLEQDDDLYYATKVAVHCFAETQSSGQEVTPKSKYEVAHRIGIYQTGITLEEVQRRGRKVLEVAQQIYDYGKNGTDNYIKATVTVSAGSSAEQTLNGTKYLVQNYSVSANKELFSYEVSISSFPNGTKILNSTNQETSKMNNGTFKVAIPTDAINEDTTGYINITEAKVQTYPVFYAQSGNSIYQSYIIADPTETTSARATLKIDAHKATLKIVKKDGENNKPLKGVVFNVKYADGTNIGDFTTDDSGTATITKLKQSKIIVTEKSTLNGYILDATAKEVQLAYGETKTLTITNAPQKGNLVVYKVDASDHAVKIEGAKFKVFDSKDNYVNTITTNSEGVARLDNINVGTYKIQEESVNEFYRLNTDKKVLEVKWSKEYGDSTITIENEQKTGFIEIKKLDKEAKEKYKKDLGVAGVTFGIFDEDGNKVQELVTDTNGYAKSSELTLMKKYVVKELKTRDEYITNNTEFNVNLTEDGIVDGKVYSLTVLNEHKKGNLFVEKITKDDKTIQLGNIEFELYLVGNGEINLYIGTYYTDANGEIYIENLNTGKYMLKETANNRWYYLADDTPIEVKWYEEFGDTKVTIENEKKKGIIKVIKTDADFNEHPLEGISFDVYDEDNNYIETIITNSDGIAQSSRLRIDKKYYVYEKNTLKTYILDETIHDVDFTKDLTKEQIENLQEDSIFTINLTNEHQKGKLKVIKVDADNNSIPIENVEFELYVKNVDAPYTENQLIGKYKTNSERNNRNRYSIMDRRILVKRGKD